MEELERIARACDGRAKIEAWFVADADLGVRWTRSDLWERAERIPGVACFEDAGGAKARSMGAETSGTALLYAPDGRLVFSGGITGARGHAGENAGLRAVVDLLNGRPAARTKTDVFGCALSDREASGAP